MPAKIVRFIGQPQSEHALWFDVSVLHTVLCIEDAACGRTARREEECCREQHPFFPVLFWFIILLFCRSDFVILSIAVRSL